SGSGRITAGLWLDARLLHGVCAGEADLGGTMKQKILAFMALFGSASTLLCCALPAAIAAVAGGAAVGAFLSAFPWLVRLSMHKGVLFIVAGAMVAITGSLTLRPQGRLACAVMGGKGCEAAGAFQRVSFWFSL